MKKKNGIIWETITVRMTQEEKETLRKIAEEEDLTLTIYVKRLLRREIRSRSLRVSPATVEGKWAAGTVAPILRLPDDTTGGAP